MNKVHRKYRAGKTVAEYLMIIVLAAALLTGCRSLAEESEERTESEESEELLSAVQQLNKLSIYDKAQLYAKDVDDSIVHIYLTVQEGNEAEGTNHTWEDINAYSVYDYQAMGVERYKAEAIVQFGDENGPLPSEVGYNARIPNAVVSIRGATSSTSIQKNYKIKLNKDMGEWRGQRTINLNKHRSDPSKIANKLSYDLMKAIPEMMSCRTQFVYLHVKDETSEDGSNAEFVDYGLYTHVEQINTRYLKNHGLDDNGQLYKATQFEFWMEEALKLKTDPDYDEEEFNKILEIKGNDDHSKLLQMVEDLNSYHIPIEETFEKYFDDSNFFTWLAFHILIGNRDITSQNYFLYSPQNGTKFYFISWDNDGGWQHRMQTLEDCFENYNYTMGIGNMWGVVLIQRLMKSEQLSAKLDARIEELYQFMNKEYLQELIDMYSAATKPIMYSMPDLQLAYVTEERYDIIMETLADEIEINYQLYFDSRDRPLPFFLDTPYIDGDELVLQWDKAYDFNYEEVTYKVEIADGYTFENMLYEESDLMIPTTSIKAPEPGKYFIRITATNERGKSNTCMEEYIDTSDYAWHYGVKCIYIMPDGSIEEVMRE